MRAVVLAVLSALVLAPSAADAFRGGGDCSDIPRFPSDRRGDGQGRSNRLTLATFDARWIATMSPVNATAKGEKQDKAVADRLRAEDRERYRAFGKLLAEIKADVVDVSGTNGCGALRQMLSAEVQLLPEHASKVRQYLHERPEDKGIAMRHTGMLTYVDPSASITRVDDARMAYPIPHTRCPADERDRADQSSSCESEYSCAAADDADADASSCAADAARSCDAARTGGVTGPPKDHYVTRMAVGNKNVTLLVVHFDEPDWSCARREAAATIAANEAARTRRGGLGFGGESPGGESPGGESPGGASSEPSPRPDVPSETRRSVAVIVTLPPGSCRPDVHASPVDWSTSPVVNVESSDATPATPTSQTSFATRHASTRSSRVTVRVPPPSPAPVARVTTAHVSLLRVPPRRFVSRVNRAGIRENPPESEPSPSRFSRRTTLTRTVPPPRG